MPTSKLWVDLTVDHAEVLRGFYSDVIGWKSEAVDVGEYNDYIMTENGELIAGICHNRDTNYGVPPVWIPYFEVESLEKSLQMCINQGGSVIKPIAVIMESKQYAVIQDPCGAVCAIWSETITSSDR